MYSVWLIGLLIFSGFFFNKLPGSNLFWWPLEAIESRSYTKNLVGVSFVLPKPIYELNSERHFNGDGRSFSVYKLNEKIIKKLNDQNSTLLTNYPKKGIREDWKLRTWTSTPIKPEDLDAFHFASNAKNESEYNLKDLLNEHDNYYAFKYYRHSFSNASDLFLNVDFYLLSPKRRILIVINVNT